MIDVDIVIIAISFMSIDLEKKMFIFGKRSTLDGFLSMNLSLLWNHKGMLFIHVFTISSFNGNGYKIIADIESFNEISATFVKPVSI